MPKTVEPALERPSPMPSEPHDARLHSGSIALEHAAPVRAEGSGYMHHVARELTLEGTVEGGILTVGGDARVWVERSRSRHENPDGSVTYDDPRGGFTVTGRGIEVTCVSERIAFSARGDGSARFAGSGWFAASGGARRAWPVQGRVSP